MPIPFAMADLAEYGDELHVQALYLEAVTEILVEANSAALPTLDRERDLEFALTRVGEYRELIERMLRDLDREA